MVLFPKSPLARPLRVVFLGTPQFAAVCLESLVTSSHHVVGVVTAPDRPAGRGQKIQESAVKETAKKYDLPVLQPTNLKSTEFLDSLNQWRPDICVVVAFRMLPEVVWSAPAFGTINLHASLLPNLRGAAPIHRAIMCGLKETGVTTFSLKHKIDTGDILLQRSTPIDPLEHTGNLHDRLSTMGKSLILETLDQLTEGKLKGKPQDSDSPASSRTIFEAPKLHKIDCRIDWNQPCETVNNHIRGLYPFPKAWCKSPFGELKILESKTSNQHVNSHLAGETKVDGKILMVACQDRWIQICKLIPPGKRAMSVTDWINGLSSKELGNWNKE